ncbi:hypothetical protein STPH1_7581 [Streptomyces sp. OM5714]|nr:hypothetical protein STPH1_7581 [Streptomyces sp. OM5714]
MRVGITGHRGLSMDVEDKVRGFLADRVQQYDPAGLVGVSCIADGSDSWFAQAVLRHGGRLEVVVPAAEYRESLLDWHHPVHDPLLSRAAGVHHTGMTESTSQAHQTGSEILRCGCCGRRAPDADGAFPPGVHSGVSSRNRRSWGYGLRTQADSWRVKPMWG